MNQNFIKLNIDEVRYFLIKENYEYEDLSNTIFFGFLRSKILIGIIGFKNNTEICLIIIQKKHQEKGYGKRIFSYLINWCFIKSVPYITINTTGKDYILNHILSILGFYEKNKTSHKILWELIINGKNVYDVNLNLSNNRFEKSLILNPTENLPYYEYKKTKAFEGLYVSENYRDSENKIIFGGRDELIELYNIAKVIWKKNLKAADVDLRTFSGLNSHLLFFLCVSKKNDTVMLLPEEAGGHFSTGNILKKLGLKVEYFLIDEKNHRIDIKNSKTLIQNINPNFIFIDRSEGLTYEDFGWLCEFTRTIKIFDASQYLTQILTQAYPNPFCLGFDIILSTLHKNYPGPQKCIVATRENNHLWNEYISNSNTFISNNHPRDIFNSIIPLLDLEKLKLYSIECLQCSKALSSELYKLGVSVILRDNNEYASLHTWIVFETKEKAYNAFLKLEEMNFLTNYRLLPYKLGYGLRIGISAAVRQGLRLQHISLLAQLISEILDADTIQKELKIRCSNFIKSIIVK